MTFGHPPHVLDKPASCIGRDLVVTTLDVEHVNRDELQLCGKQFLQGGGDGGWEIKLSWSCFLIPWIISAFHIKYPLDTVHY